MSLPEGYHLHPPDNILGSRILGVAPPDQLLHLVNVEGGHDLGEGHVLGNGPGHTDLHKIYVPLGKTFGNKMKFVESDLIRF